MTNEDPPTTQFPPLDGPQPNMPPPPYQPTAPPSSRRTLRPWMWIAPAVLVVAVAAFFGGRAIASSASSPTSQAAVSAPVSGDPAPRSGAPESAAPQSVPAGTPSGSAAAAGSGGKKTAKAGKTGKAGAAAVIGILQTMSGSTWTVQKADGTTVTVTISATTQYGTKAKPQTTADFKTGEHVVVQADKSAVGQSAVTAKRVVSRMPAGIKAGTSAGTTAPTTVAPTTA